MAWDGVDGEVFLEAREQAKEFFPDETIRERNFRIMANNPNFLKTHRWYPPKTEDEEFERWQKRKRYAFEAGFIKGVIWSGAK